MKLLKQKNIEFTQLKKIKHLILVNYWIINYLLITGIDNLISYISLHIKQNSFDHLRTIHLISY